VQHDLREDHIAQADAARAQHLAQRLALPFALAHVRVRAQQGNPEALARAARYRALIALAREHACPFIATAHQGDDALETFLMRAMRGSGPRGLAGLLASRRTQGATIIRPMLTLSREDTLAICTSHAWTPALDHTNFLPGSLPDLPADTQAHTSTPLRTRVRALLLPTIKALFPHAIASTSRVSAVQHSLARSLQARSRRLTRRIHQHATPTAQGLSFPKALLLRHDDALLHETLRRLIAQHTKGQGLDALSTRATHRAITRIRSTSPHASTLRLGPATLHITRTTITITTRATP
jgi:tRNA(Ile)-lysidine synthetase-like protein